MNTFTPIHQGGYTLRAVSGKRWRYVIEVTNAGIIGLFTRQTQATAALQRLVAAQLPIENVTKASARVTFAPIADQIQTIINTAGGSTRP